MRPVSSRIVPEKRGFSGIFAGLYAVYEKFAGKLRDDCGMGGLCGMQRFYSIHFFSSHDCNLLFLQINSFALDC